MWKIFEQQASKVRDFEYEPMPNSIIRARTWKCSTPIPCLIAHARPAKGLRPAHHQGLFRLIKMGWLRLGRQTEPAPARIRRARAYNDRPDEQRYSHSSSCPRASPSRLRRSACGYAARPVSAVIRKMFRIASSLDTVLRASRTMKGTGRRGRASSPSPLSSSHSFHACGNGVCVVGGGGG